MGIVYKATIPLYTGGGGGGDTNEYMPTTELTPVALIE